MNENKNLSLNDIVQRYNIDDVEALTKIVEDREQKAFLDGYDYAIEILSTCRVPKKDNL